MADLLIDEWIWSDLSGENSKKHQGETLEFLDVVFKKCDRLISVSGSPFQQKFTSLLKHQNVTQQRIAKLLGNKFFRNFNKTKLLQEDELQELTENLTRHAKLKPSDHYLVRAYLTSHAEEFITTDNDLRDALSDNGISCKHRDEFVPAYIAQHGKK